jgi:hypothetical protein
LHRQGIETPPVVVNVKAFLAFEKGHDAIGQRGHDRFIGSFDKP